MRSSSARRAGSRIAASRDLVLCLGVIWALAVPCRAPAEKPPEATTLVNPPWSHCYGLHRVNQTHLNFYSGYRKKFRSPQGIAAVKLRANDAPGRQDDDELTVYGVNSGSNEIIYNTSLLSVDFFQMKDGSQGSFRNPTGIAADEDGLVVVADTGNDRVVFLRNENNSVRFDRSITLDGHLPPLRSPRGIAAESDSIYIADTGNDRIVVLDREGEYVHEIRSRQALYAPFGVAVISNETWNHYNSGFIVVTDSLNRRITRLALDGSVEVTRRFGEISDQAGGFFYPAIDYYSNIYATDTLGGCIYKFDKSLEFLTRTNCDPDWEIRLDQPRGLTIYRRFGQLFVAERQGASYFWLGTDIRHLRCTAERSGNSLIISTRFLLTEHSFVTIDLENETGETIKSFVVNSFTEPGPQTGVYSIDQPDRPVDFANCMYVLVVTAKPTYSSKKFLSVEKRAPVRIQG